MTVGRAGECVDRAPYLSEMDFRPFRMRVSTERYYSREFQERERERLWMRVWQIVGRAVELPQAGDWKVHNIFDQSYILVRGKDQVIRGFVNACRHRGNRICSGKGHSAGLRCVYHNWLYGLDGQLLTVAHPDFEGTIDDFVAPKGELGLLPVRVECFAGFIFLNPDRNAPPLAEFLGEARDILAAYRLEEMVPAGINVRERLDCNWKVVMDAFGEGYHTQGVHPELIGVVDLTKERFHALGLHCLATTPFGGPDLAKRSTDQQVETFLNLPTSHFPGLTDALKRFAGLLAGYRGKDEKLAFPHGVTARSLLQQAVRETFTAKGLDVGGLTDSQMIDYHFWLFFPNVFLQVCAGECTTIIVEPDPGGDPNRCFWRVMTLQWLPPDQRAAKYTGLTEIPEGDHFPYFLALEQDYRQMPIAQEGLRNRALQYMVLTKHEPRVAHFHTTLDSWIG